MPLYVYECGRCNTRTDVAKSVRLIDSPEKCAVCGHIMHRVIQPCNFQMEPWADNGEYNPGLGCVVKNKAHKREILRRYKEDHGSELIEVGNEDPRKHIENVDDRHRREMREHVEKCLTKR